MKISIHSWMILILAGVCTAAQGANPETSILIETSQLAARLSEPNLRIIDARSASEYQASHILGAVNLPASDTDSLPANVTGFPIPAAQAEELFREAGINQSSQVVVYDSQGHRLAARIFFVLEFFGHPRVAVLNGGFPKWQTEGNPITTEKASVKPGDFKPDVKPGVMATADWVKQNLNQSGIKLVDARSPEEYAGSPAQGARSGHIPGAVNLEWKKCMGTAEVPTIIDTAELKRLFTDAGVEPSQEVVAYCQTGTRASMIYFALRLLGYPRVRLYDGSWAEWGALADAPIEK